MERKVALSGVGIEILLISQWAKLPSGDGF
jgi:hypothetical protein